MIRCPACSHEVHESSRFCPSCGAAIETPTSAPTETSLESDSPAASHPSDQARFIPGTVLAKRYRIVSLLGRGGMGEVYRADDLKLGQPVALKFLPESMQRDRARLDRFLNEVKTALKVTHPSVCRVYDIGEVDGQHYISMEYVDGENLASLLRRIGRLPQDKAVQLARQLCAGLAAAHEEGILHRDLKPANVMIDGRGRAKITDFGLASLAEGVKGEEARAGTPAYMAPEQLEGKEVTVRSDLYALGLVLYELFTGKRAFEASTPAEMLRLERESTPSSPSDHVAGIDPAVERAILRCLAREPGERPGSALSVSAALPGGDPLAAALAAGETPSPELVADAGGEGSLRPGVAVLLFVAVLVGLAIDVSLEARGRLFHEIPLPKPVAELTIEAREIVDEAGYVEPPADRVFGFERDDEYFHWKSDDSSPDRWDDLASVRPVPFWFWYRQSPRPMVPANYVGWLTYRDPPIIESGMIGVRLDPEGRLLRFEAVPPEWDLHEAEESGAEPDWAMFFDRAGLDPGDFGDADPDWAPPIAADTRWAWTAAATEPDEEPLRVEAGSFGGRPVYFEVIPAWRDRRVEPPPVPPGQMLAAGILLVFFFVVLLGGLLLARRNLRLGRGDRRGAFRLAAFVLVIEVFHRVLRIDHVPAVNDEILILADALSTAFLAAALFWLFYVALEPYVRRLWPDTLIAWRRLLDGRVKDPLIGRHVLWGALVGVAMTCLFWLGIESHRWLGLPALAPSNVGFESLEGWPETVGAFSSGLTNALLLSVFLLLGVVLLRIVLRRLWAAVLLLILMFGTVGGAQDPESPVLGAVLLALFSLVMITVLVRLGLLALGSALAFNTWGKLVVTTDPSAWYFGRTLAIVLVLAAIACWAFYTSLGGQRLFTDRVLDG
jgi:serine/threonine-protein kinase